MPFYIVIAKRYNPGVMSFSSIKNPSEKELLEDLKGYSKLYLLQSLEDAKKVAELFFHNNPKAGGQYGLIAEVNAEFGEIPVAKDVDSSAIYNDWAESLQCQNSKKENANVNCSCVMASPKQIKSISQFFIPDAAKACNRDLQDTVFDHTPSNCLVM